ncbi:cupin domain-containing protein [Prosthecodimorpha staleyi]|uniref:DUF861 domain-containing protein n=1 Tax=Prosthecodimorpha staleyi TaxID=2840188 RepID=A0A947GBJ3_9HYPH|nr:cupin domain-containing protein [Prosthecodimorpha staleyi]MBT9290343.1 DUF861 domain-containing protein [Prosthecodimorpha staleyi]
MSNPLIVVSRTDGPLRPSPIEPSWIHEGNPVASNAILSTSADGTASTIVWECTEGKFEWHYDVDETIHFLEGSVVIEADGMAPQRLGAGDVIFFKRGAVARWHVEKKVRKLAFFRRTVPGFVGFAIKVAGKLRRMIGGAGTPSGSLQEAR